MADLTYTDLFFKLTDVSVFFFKNKIHPDEKNVGQSIKALAKYNYL